MRNITSLLPVAREITSAESIDRVRAATSIDDRLAQADSESFRVAMRQLAGGVCVIAHGVGVERAGQTATSVASLSVDPPSLIVCVSRASSSYPGLAPILFT
jgi:flavin reductase (DIM6/NTAB) family NADH-FMN oxidoreductase RutF